MESRNSGMKGLKSVVVFNVLFKYIYKHYNNQNGQGNSSWNKMLVISAVSTISALLKVAWVSAFNNLLLSKLPGYKRELLMSA